MKAVLDQWSKRRISIAGKINIIKSLVTSKPIYAITNLASPDIDYWNEVNKLLYSFVHNGKSEKIKRDVLIGPYKEGGYRMIDLQSQNQALKISWITKLLNIEGIWKSYVINKIPVDIRYMARCNIKFADLPFKFHQNSLWNEIWLNWCVENYIKEIDTVELILNQNLWYNSHITRNKKPIYMKKWEQQGIRWISDIIHEDNDPSSIRLLSREEIELLYDLKVDFVTYQGIIHSIPAKWRKKISLHNINSEASDEEGDYKLIDKLQDSKRPTKLIYDIKIKNKFAHPVKALNKWKEELDVATSEEILRTHYNQRAIIINQKIKSFNYMFLQRNIPHESRLFKMKITDTECCETCNIKETIKHLYWECPHTIRLWERLKYIIEQYLHSHFSLHKAKCMLGTGVWISKRNKECIWLLCIITKHYIHLCKCNKEERNPKGLENYIKSILRLERSLATRKGKINLFTNKWGDVINWIES